jgi:hypothetical protein
MNKTLTYPGQVTANGPNVAPLDLAASAQAPIIFFENAATYGMHNAIVCITLETSRLLSVEPGPVHMDRVVVAHLRMSVKAANSLKSAVEKVLLLASQASSDAQN